MARSTHACNRLTTRFFASEAAADNGQGSNKTERKPVVHQFEMNPPEGVEVITLFLRPVPKKWRDEKTGSLVMGVYNELLKPFGQIYGPSWLQKNGYKDFNCLFVKMERKAGERAISEINGKVPVPFGENLTFTLTEAIRKDKPSV